MRNVACASGGYLEARAAAAARRARGGSAPVSPPKEEAPSRPKEATAAAVSRSQVAAGEPAPSEAVSQVLAALGSRIASGGRPLKPKELDRFLNNLDTIIVSLGGEKSNFMPPPPQQDSKPQISEAYADDDDIPPEMEDDEAIHSITDDRERAQAMYSMPVGTRNTYQIPDMEKMTPEEYLAALNKRTVEFQAGRRRHAPKAATSEYFSSIEQKKS